MRSLFLFTSEINRNMGPVPKWYLCFNSNQRFDETLARHAGLGSTIYLSSIL